MIRKAVPEVEIAREEIGDVHALFRQRLCPGRAEGRAEERVLARGADLPVRSPHRNFLPIRAHAEVLGVRSLKLGEAKRKVVPQHLLVLRRQR